MSASTFAAAIGIALAWTAVGAPALAQTAGGPGGFSVREVSLSTGFGSVQLPPISLGGTMPSDALDADQITSAAAAIEWRKTTPRAAFALDFSGGYTARSRYSQMNASAGDLTFSASRQVGRRWQLSTAASDAVTTFETLVFQPTQAGRLVEHAASFDELAGTVSLARSPSPDLTQAVLFVPITQSLAASDVYGSRVMALGTRADVVYTHSARLATFFHTDYTTARRLGSSGEPGQAVPFLDSTAESASWGLRYGRSERSQLTAALKWSQVSGGFSNEVASAVVGYGWSGRKWLWIATIGPAVQLSDPAAVVAHSNENPVPAIVSNAALGYKFGGQTLVVQYIRESHDEYGHGGRNLATGFEGNVQSVNGSWSWAAPRSRWLVRSEFSMLRGPGNFSYIYAWLATGGIGRQLGPELRMMAEAVYDRHGSRGFEGFHLTREGARLTVIWVPRRRQVVRS
jgi:hypothetical protein